MMISKKRVVSAVAALSLCAMVGGVAMAYGGGHRGGRGGERSLFLLAHAAGVTHTQMKAAFKANEATMKADHAALKTARESLVSCLVSGADCSSQASAFMGAKQTAEKDKLAFWQGLFKGNPNPKKATAVLTEMRQMRESRKKFFEGLMGGEHKGGWGHEGGSDHPDHDGASAAQKQ